MATTSAPAFELSGGALCLDFANTGSEQITSPIERLFDYADLLTWSLQAGTITAREADALLADAAARPAQARAALRRAVALREAIYRVFSAVAARRQPSSGYLDLLNDWFVQVARRRVLVSAKRGFHWQWRTTPGSSFDRPLWPIVLSAAALLGGERHDAIRECAAETCGWLFLDQSRNQSRRWCDMKVCGNREKARRFYHRSTHGV